MPNWDGLGNLAPKIFRCGYCGEKVSSEKGYYPKQSNERIYICPNCLNPSYFSGDKQYPGEPFGEKVKNVPEDIDKLYNEACKSASVQAYTASVMACRKLLMNIAVQKGAKKNLTFQQYVEYLDAQHYIPPDGKEWVDHIRKKGNEANHEIVIMGKEDAKDLIIFIEMLLKFIYEFPSRVKPKPQKNQT